jgi:hypothetical protein
MQAGRTVVGWIIGPMVGFASCAGVWKLGSWAIDQLKLSKPDLSRTQLLVSWILCSLLLAWIPLSAVIGFWMTRFVVHCVV